MADVSPLSLKAIVQGHEGRILVKSQLMKGVKEKTVQGKAFK